MSERPVYEVHAELVNAKTWGLTCPQVPGAVSLVRRLADAEEHIREAIAYVAGVDPDGFDIRVRPLPGSEVAKELEEIRSLGAHADQLQREAGERMRVLVRQLKDRGISGADLAVILEVSPQRVSQLLGGAR